MPMRRAILVSFVLCVGCATAPDSAKQTESSDMQMTTDDARETGFEYPETRRTDTVDEMFGTQVHDPYRWLEDGSKKEVETWMSRQDKFTRRYLEDLPLRERLRKRYRELYYIDAMSSPTPRDDRIFYARQHADKQKDVHYWRPVDGSAGDEEVLLDPNEMGDGENVSVGTLVPSHDGSKVAYTLKENNADAATLYVMDVESGEVSDVDVIEGAKWAYPSWTPDNEGFYYTHFPTDSSIPEDERTGEADVRYHELGTPPSKDRIVHGPTGNPRTTQSIKVSRDGDWLVRTVSFGWNRTDVFVRRRSNTDGEWKTLIEGKPNNYRVRVWNDHFYVVTDDGAPRSRLMKVDAESLDRSDWKEIVPEQEKAVLKFSQIIGGKLVLTYLKNAHSHLEIRDLDGSLVREVDLPGLGSTYGMSGEPDRDRAYFGFESFTQPRRIFSTSIQEGGTEVWSSEELPVDTEDFVSKQVWFESKDGTEASMFVVHEKGALKDGPIPFMMYGYGGFNISLTPFFDESAIPWMEAGGGFAVVNLRGGGEYGESWHEAGMKKNKQNTFDDFISAAEFLIDEEMTTSEGLAIEGGSNGGLLVSAVTVQRPELFGAVLCHVPLTDMIRFPDFGPAKLWVPEYGDPTKEEMFDYLYSYSPYHNVEKGTEYPAFMMLSSANDDRVHPMHARKMAAQLQWATTSRDEPVLFRLEKDAGHGGADLVRSTVSEKVDVMTFLFEHLEGAEWSGPE